MQLTERQRSLLDQSLYDALDLPERTVNALEEINVYTLEQLLQCTREQLLAIPNFGEKTVEKIYEHLAKEGFYRPVRQPKGD